MTNRILLVSSFHEAGAWGCENLKRFELFHRTGEFRLAGGLLKIPVEFKQLGRTAHLDFREPAEDDVQKWHGMSGWRQRRHDFNGNEGHQRAQDFYNESWATALRVHLNVLVQPFVKTVTVPGGMEHYWVEASLVEAKAMELMETSTDTGLDVIDRLSSLNAHAAELRISLEEMDNQGLYLHRITAPELHKVYEERSEVLRYLLSELVLELDEARRYLVKDLTSLASTRWAGASA